MEELLAEFEGIFANGGTMDFENFSKVCTPLLSSAENRVNAEGDDAIKIAFDEALEDPTKKGLTFQQCAHAIQSLGVLAGPAQDTQDSQEEKSSSKDDERGSVSSASNISFQSAEHSRMEKWVEKFRDMRPQDINLTYNQAKSFIVAIAKKYCDLQKATNLKLNEKEKEHAEILSDVVKKLKDEWDLVLVKLNHHKTEITLEMAALKDEKEMAEKEWSQEKDSLARRLSQSQAENRDFQRLKTKTDAKSALSEKKAQTLEEDLMKAQANNEILENTVRKLEKFLTNERNTTQRLADQLDGLEEDNAGLSDEVLKMRDEMETRDIQFKELEVNLAVSKEDLNRLQSAREADLDMIQGNGAVPSALRSQRSDSIAEPPKSLAAELDSFNDANENEEEAELLEKELFDAKKTISMLQSVKTDLEGQRKKAHLERDKALDHVKESEKRIKEETQKLEKVKLEITKVTVEHEEKIENEKAKHTQAVRAIKATHTNELTELQTSYEEVVEKGHKAGQTNKLLKQQLDESTSKSQELTKEQTALREEKRKLEQELSTARAELQTVQQERDKDKRQMLEKENQLTRTQQRTIKLEEQLEKQVKREKKAEARNRSSAPKPPDPRGLAADPNAIRFPEDDQQQAEPDQDPDWGIFDQFGESLDQLQARIDAQTRKFFMERQKLNKKQKGRLSDQLDMAAFVNLLVNRKQHTARRRLDRGREKSTSPEEIDLADLESEKLTGPSFPVSNYQPPDQHKSIAFKRLVAPPPLPADLLEAQSEASRRRKKRKKGKKGKPPPFGGQRGPPQKDISHSTKTRREVLLPGGGPTGDPLLNPAVTNTWPLKALMGPSQARSQATTTSSQTGSSVAPIDQLQETVEIGDAIDKKIEDKIDDLLPTSSWIDSAISKHFPKLWNQLSGESSPEPPRRLLGERQRSRLKKAPPKFVYDHVVYGSMI